MSTKAIVALDADELQLIIRSLHTFGCSPDPDIAKRRVRLARRLAQARLEALGLQP